MKVPWLVPLPPLWIVDVFDGRFLTLFQPGGHIMPTTLSLPPLSYEFWSFTTISSLSRHNSGFPNISPIVNVMVFLMFLMFNHTLTFDIRPIEFYEDFCLQVTRFKDNYYVSFLKWRSNNSTNLAKFGFSSSIFTYLFLNFFRKENWI